MPEHHDEADAEALDRELERAADRVVEDMASGAGEKRSPSPWSNTISSGTRKSVQASTAASGC